MRLNKAVRDEITRNATKTLQEREDALLKREYVLADRCYKHALAPKLRALLDALSTYGNEKNGPTYLNTTREVNFNVAGQTVRMRFGLPDHAAVYRPVPNRYHVYSDRVGEAITMTLHEGLVNEVRAWQSDKAQFEKDKKAAEVTLTTVLKSVGSTESLFKVWPEGKKFYSSPPLTPVVKTGVPAVQMQALNQMLGLS